MDPAISPPGRKADKPARRRGALFAPHPADSHGRDKATRKCQVTFDAEVDDLLTLHATLNRQSRSEVVNRVVGRWLRENGRKRELMLGEAIDQLAAEAADMASAIRGKTVKHPAAAEEGVPESADAA